MRYRTGLTRYGTTHQFDMTATNCQLQVRYCSRLARLYVLYRAHPTRPTISHSHDQARDLHNFNLTDVWRRQCWLTGITVASSSPLLDPSMYNLSTAPTTPGSRDRLEVRTNCEKESVCVSSSHKTRWPDSSMISQPMSVPLLVGIVVQGFSTWQSRRGGSPEIIRPS